MLANAFGDRLRSGGYAHTWRSFEINISRTFRLNLVRSTCSREVIRSLLDTVYLHTYMYVNMYISNFKNQFTYKSDYKMRFDTKK